jgi:hypothetical protein
LRRNRAEAAPTSRDLVGGSRQVVVTPACRPVHRPSIARCRQGCTAHPR